MTCEIVLYATQRTESLVALWYLAALWLLMREAQDGKRSWPWVFLCSVLGVASKEVFVTAPFVLLACDRAFFAGSVREALRARASFYLALTVPCLGFAFLQRGNPYSDSVRGPELDYVLAQARIVPGYLGTALWPAHPVLDYGRLWPQRWHDIWPWVMVSIVLFVAGVVCVWRKPRPGFLAAWVFGILVPTSTLLSLHTEVGAERRFYLPLLGVLAYAFVALGRGLARVGGGARTLIALTGLMVLVLGMRTHEYAANYQSVRAFWQGAIIARPDNPRGYYNLGVAQRDDGEPDAALASFNAALAVQDGYVDAHTNVASLLVKRGEYAAAVEHTRRVVELAPDAVPTYYTFAQTLMFNGQTAEALSALEQAVRLAPDFVAARVELVQSYRRLGQLSDAHRHAAALRAYASQATKKPTE